MNRKRWLLAVAVLVALGAITPSCVRAYRVEGASDAPSFLVGERILVNNAAYDLRLPYTDVVIFSHSKPERGDVVMFRCPGQDYLVFKRVIGCPGDRVVMRDNHLEINGIPLQYEQVDGKRFRSVADRNKLGALIEKELGNGPEHLTTHTPGTGTDATFGPVEVPAEHYFVMGDSRDNSEDSRMYGSIPGRSVRGRVFRAPWSRPQIPPACKGRP